jgi:riboflavin kinase/FMN adenylyltransferase
MLHYHSLENLNVRQSYATIGVYDGIHLGHQAIISSLSSRAKETGATSVVVTFDPHPALVLKGIQTPIYLTDVDEKIQLLEDLGVDITITLPFTHQVAELTAQQFIEPLQHAIKLTQLWVGEGFVLGHNREGDISNLSALGYEIGFQVVIVQNIVRSGEKISSSQIRQVISSGEVNKAERYLGRPYSISGKVIHGEGRGSQIGIPTANISVPALRLLPVRGVYATYAWIDQIRYASVTNIGFRPTFFNTAGEAHIETYIFDFNKYIYDKILRLEFIQFVRPETKFDSISELVLQIHGDIRKSKELLHYESS